MLLGMVSGVTGGLLLALALARPRRPPGLDPLIWLVYGRALGGWERLRIACVIALLCWSLAALLAVTASIPSAALSQRREPCYRYLAGAGYGPTLTARERAFLRQDCT